jgi:uncharacterized protein YnzC (UPF0291/DUF896 family)
MVTTEDISRINELYHKSKTSKGLTEEEREEQQRLRKAYIASVRENLNSYLSQIEIKDSFDRA